MFVFQLVWNAFADLDPGETSSIFYAHGCNAHQESCVLFFQKTRDPTLKYRMERTPFLEEQVRKLREDGKDVNLDLERLLLSEENKFDFVNEIIAEGNRFIENNPDEYIGKKAVLHALSNRLNDAGIYRPEAYYEPDPYRPPGYIRDDLKRMEKISQGRR